jgi:Tol biopolymer transport system component
VVAKVLASAIAIAVVAIAILAVPAIRHLREAPPPPPPPIRLSLSPPPGTELGSGDDTLDAALSPDQRSIIFVATKDGTARLWRRALDNDRAEEIPGTDGAQSPAWKQTGNLVTFFAGSRLKAYSLSRNTVDDLGVLAPASSGASWLADGSLLFAPDARGPIRRLLNGSVTEATKLHAGERSHTFPMAVDSTNAFVYVATFDDGRRVARLVDNGREFDLGTTSGHAQMVGTVVLTVRDGVLLAQRIDPETRQRAGNANPVALDVGIAVSGHGFFVASSRLLITASSTKRLRQLAWYDLESGRSTPTREPGDYWQVRLSPDDRFAALTQTTPLVRTLDVVLAPMSETGYVEPLTRAVAADSDPVWSPDGRRLAFRSFQDGPPRLYTHPAHDQDATDAIVPMSATDETPTDWRDDRVLIHGPGAKGDLDLSLAHDKTGAREVVAGSGFNESDGRLSSDGRWLAYVSDESGQPDVYAMPWPRGARVRVSFAGGTRPRWGRDGRILFFVRGSEIMRADLSASGFTTPRSVLGIPGLRDYDVAHRSDRVLALVPGPAVATAAVAVVTDWQSLLR